MPRFDITGAVLGNLTDPKQGMGVVAYLLDAEDAVGRNAGEKLAEIVSAKDFGAVGDGVADDTAALSAAVRHCASGLAALYLPPGTYLVSQPLVGNRGSDQQRGFSIFGPPAASGYNTSWMPSVLKATPAFPSGEAILDLQLCRQTHVSHLGFDGTLAVDGSGVPVARGLAYGASTTGSYQSHHTVEECAIYGFYRGISGQNSNCLRIRRNNISGCWQAGIYLYAGGDSDIDGNYINTNNPTYGMNSGEDDLQLGCGILFDRWSGNSNIRGGKIEWNAKGIMIYGSVGVTVIGVNFDYNAWFHIGVMPHYFGSGQSHGIVLLGNRMVGGAFRKSAAADWGGSAVEIKAYKQATPDVPYEAVVTLVGNSIHRANWGAADYATDPAPSPAPTVDGAHAADSTEIKLSSLAGIPTRGSVYISPTVIDYNGLNSGTKELLNCTAHPPYSGGQTVLLYVVGPLDAAVKVDASVTGSRAYVLAAENDLWSCARGPVGANPYSIIAIGDGTDRSAEIFGDMNMTTSALALSGGAVAFTGAYGTGYRETYGAAAPAAGTWHIGDRVINTAPASSGYLGWVCTADGVPGTWRGFGVIA